MRARLDELHLAFSFFTRLPLPDFQGKETAFKDTLWAWPLVGLTIGAAASLAYWMACALGFDPTIAGLFALVLPIVITGALHEDGLADCADSFGGYSPQQRLEIMKDSRIGTFGVLALIMAIIFKWSALEALEPPAIYGALILAPALSRASVFAALVIFPIRSGAGLRQGLLDINTRKLIITLAIWLIIIIVFSGFQWIAVFFALSLAVMTAALMQRQIGGLTGDVFGAMIVICEIGFLVLYSLNPIK